MSTVYSQATIDVLKMDIEGSEWPSLEVIFRENLFKNVKQFVLEVHLGENVADPRQYQLVQKLEEIGFRKFNVHVNHYSRFVTSTGRRLTCCYELSYINLKYLSNG